MSIPSSGNADMCFLRQFHTCNHLQAYTASSSELVPGGRASATQDYDPTQRLRLGSTKVQLVSVPSFIFRDLSLRAFLQFRSGVTLIAPFLG